MLTDSSRHHDFPSLADCAYLNTAAESIPPRCVGDALRRYYEQKCRGMRGRDDHFAQLEACRSTAARMLGLQSNEVSFCSCSSEAYNLLASALPLMADSEVIVSDLDFPAGVTPWLRARIPPVLRQWCSHEGELSLERLLPLLNEKTALVQVSLVSFYNGFRLDWAPFCEAVRRHAPHAVISVDITQALGRVELDCAGADILISSTHKWTLGMHGGCIVGIPASSAARLTTRGGGWFHLVNAFDPDRFERAVSKTGAASFSVGMPGFSAIYALQAALRYVEDVGVAAISAHADPLVARVESGLLELGLKPMCAWRKDRPTGIVAFKHERSAAIHAELERRDVQVMHNAGRLRISVHGYNTGEEIERCLSALAGALRQGSAGGVSSIS
jgi:cysteine desulfurase / selenocysteine lyase